MKNDSWPCSNPCVTSYVDKSGITTICINTADTSHCNPTPRKTTSSGYSNGWAASSSSYNSPIRNIDEAMRKLPESTPYVRPEFVPYTQPSQPFVQPDIPHYIPPNKELSTSEKKLLKTDFIKILRDLYPKDYSRHINSWPNTLWGKQVINTKDFQAIEKFFVTEFVDVLHERYPHDYPANFKDWNSKNSQWGKEVILTKNFKTIGKWLPTYKKEVLEQQKVLKNDFVEILHRVYPEDYPMNFKDWKNIWGKDVLERGDFQAIAKHLPSYKKQALKKEQNILSLVKDKSDVYLGGMSIGDYGVKLIIGGVANKFTTLNLANNKIRDEGAKLLADSLAKGKMPNLKVLHLEDNKITDKGVSYYLDNLKKDQLNSAYVSFTSSKSTIDKIMEFFGKGARYYVSEYGKAQQSSKEADIAVNGKDGFGHCVQVVRTAGIDFASAMAQKAIAAAPIVKTAMKEGHPLVKLIVGGTLVKSAFDDMKGAFLSEDFAYCMAWSKILFNDDDQPITGDNGYETNE